MNCFWWHLGSLNPYQKNPLFRSPMFFLPPSFFFLINGDFSSWLLYISWLLLFSELGLGWSYEVMNDFGGTLLVSKLPRGLDLIAQSGELLVVV